MASQDGDRTVRSLTWGPAALNSRGSRLNRSVSDFQGAGRSGNARNLSDVPRERSIIRWWKPEWGRAVAGLAGGNELNPLRGRGGGPTVATAQGTGSPG